MTDKLTSLAQLKPAPYNPRRIDDESLAALGHSLDGFGDISGLVWNSRSGNLVCGHQRLAALRKKHGKKLTLKGSAVICESGVFSVRVVDWDDITEKAANVAANSPLLSGEWDDGLGGILEEIEAQHAEWMDTLRLDELRESIPPVIPGEIVEDEVPEPPVVPISKPGDLWLLGEHRLLCGDSTKAADVERVMGGKRAALCLTDPPYGADIQYESYNDTQEALAGLIEKFWPLADAYCDCVALTPGINNMFQYPAPAWVLCWFYGVGTGRTPWGFTAWQPMMVWGADPKLAAGEGCHPDAFHWVMDGNDAQQNRESTHACPKPVSVWARFMGRLSNKKTSLVYDPFAGSGTTLIAAEQLGRKAYCIEIEPKYCDVIVARWEKLTGKKAELTNDR